MQFEGQLPCLPMMSWQDTCIMQHSVLKARQGNYIFWTEVKPSRIRVVCVCVCVGVLVYSFRFWLSTLVF